MPPSNTQTWFDKSEIVFGLIWEGRRDVMEFVPDDFAEPFNRGVEILKKPKGSREDVAKKLPLSVLQGAHDAVKRLNGLGEDVVHDNGLRKAAESYRLGKLLEKAGYGLQKNEDVDLLPLYGKITSAVSDESTGLQRADQIKFDDYNPFMPSGYDPIDSILGGIPSDGPIIAYGLQGVGKSMFGGALLEGLMNKYKKYTAAVYTLEMGAEHWLNRTVKMYGDLKKHLSRFYVSGQVHNMDELVSEVTTKRLDFVVLDDMDGIVPDIDPSSYAMIYKRVREICRFLKIPMLVLAQPNREAKLSIQNGERFLSPYDIAWSSGSENAAALLIGLQKVSGLDMKDDPQYPCADEEREFLIFQKSRDGWPGDYPKLFPKGQRGPGAIRLEPCNQMWKGKVWQNRLWRPISKNSQIGSSVTKSRKTSR